jgi:putative addiction module killer protein
MTGVRRQPEEDSSYQLPVSSQRDLLATGLLPPLQQGPFRAEVEAVKRHDTPRIRCKYLIYTLLCALPIPKRYACRKARFRLVLASTIVTIPAMAIPVREIRLLQTANGSVPFEKWFDRLKDKSAQATIDARLTRLMDGNFGDHKQVGNGVHELRIHAGPGYRVYYGLDGPMIVILITGGSKRSQKTDIQTAQELWKEYQNAK